MTTSHPLKILHIISGDLWAGAEVQALTLLTALQKIPNIEIAVVLMNEGELAQKLRAQNIRLTILPENTMGAFSLLLELRRLMNEWRPDVVHTHRIKENILGSIANRLATRARSIRTIHGAHEHPARSLRNAHKHALNFVNRWTARHLQQAIVAVSQELGDKLREEFKRENIVVIENGIDIENVCAQTHQVEIRDSHSDAKHIGFAGRLSPVKRVDLFLEMAKRLKTQHRNIDWRFHVFGDGPLKNQLIAHAKSLELEDSIIFHGHRSDIIACIAALDALVMCSDHEGMPMTLLECMCLGTPIIGHNVGGIRELLQDGKAGWPVDDHSPQGYADAVSQCVQDAAIAHARSESAKLLLEKYDAKSCAKRYINIYAS